MFASLDCLAAIYDVIFEVPSRPDGNKTGSITVRGLGRLTAPERRAVEQRSMAIAANYYEDCGWSVKDVSSYRPYDLECTKDRHELHVEVKGTTSYVFRHIELTRNEVDHCRNYPTMQLALVTGIQLMTDDSGHPVGEGGELSFVVPWMIQDFRLKPLTYVYELPIDYPRQ